MEAGGVKVQETKRAHGLLVALLLSLLLGTGPAAAADVRRPHVETADAGKATLGVRSLKRVSEAADDRDGPVLEPEEPRLVSLRPDVWPADTAFVGAGSFRSDLSPAPYQARAPPASFA